MKKRFLSMLVLLVAVVSGAWAQWTGGTHSATANENLNAINVSDDATLTINQGVTVTVSGGITVASGKTLTITGGGTLVANGANGQTGNAGGTAIAGNVIINGVGLTVTATGGQGGEGAQGAQGGKGSDGDDGEGGEDGGEGGSGARGGDGGSAFSGAVTIYAGSVTANGGTGGKGGKGGQGGTGGTGGLGSDGGQGGKGGDGGNGGNGGHAFAGTLTVYGGNVSAYGGQEGNGGEEGDGGYGGEGGFDGYTGNVGDIGEMSGDDGDGGVAYANNVTFEAATYTMTDGTDNINEVTGEQTVIITSPDVVPGPPTYAITLAEGTEEADKWTITPKEGLTGDGTETVTITYTGTKRVQSVKAVKKAATTPFTEVTTFSELQTALSAGKNVKLMDDIDCTAVISITSNGALTIDGNGKKLSTTSEIRAFSVGSTATVAFKDLTLTGFVNGGGPAINNSGTIVLDGCTISNCHVNNSNGGGAIENKGKLYAINTTFSGNYSGEIGGAINNYKGSLYMSGCTFTNNYTTRSDAYWGGAIGINLGSEVRLINCTFSGNKYGTNTGTSDIGVYNNPTNYTIAGCTGATIASRVGDITTNASGTATLDYSDLSNISFTVEQGGAAQ